jgi:hypothetical protein
MVRRDSKPKGNPTRVVLTCKRGGKYQSHGKDPSITSNKQRKGTKSFKTDCQYRVVLQRGTLFDPWIVSEQDRCTHNHGPNGISAFRKYRMEEVLPEDIKDIITWYNNQTPIKTILSNLHTKFRERDEDCVLIAKDISNIIQANRNDLLGDLTLLQWLLQRLQQAGFNPKVDVNPQTKRLTRLFFAHPEALKLYHRNLDLLFIDSTYKTNRWSMPLLNIGGVTNNNMTIQVAVCFLSEESKPDYDWAIEQLFNCITDQKVRQPRTIITDRELALINAIVKRFRFSKHILCQWHVSQNVCLKVKPHFPAPTKLKGRGPPVLNEKFLEFMDEWR